MAEKYYVYIHRKISDGKCFYVGKGSGNRLYDINSRNNKWKNIVKKYGFEAESVINNLSEKIAYELEVELIKQIGRKYLCNMTDGGYGLDGYIRTKEDIVKMGISKRGKPSWSKGKKFTEEHKHKLKLAKQNITEETRLKMSESQQNRPPIKDETRLKLRNATINQWKTQRHTKLSLKPK